MSLLQTAIRIRPRGSWEGLDLGFAMARHWFWPLLGLWLSVAVPLLLALGLTLGWDSWLSFVLWWWFKPVYEWPLLHFLSQRVFRLPGAAVLSLGSLRPQYWPALLPYLLWRRFSFHRAFTMPVGMLEGMRGRRRAKRVDLLCKRQTHVPWLFIACVHFEVVVSLSCSLGILLFATQNVAEQEVFSTFLTMASENIWLNWCVLLLQTLVVAPFYQASGFAAYLSRRTQLEAWDLELVFRALGERLRASGVLAGTAAPAQSPAGSAAASQLLSSWVAIVLMLGVSLGLGISPATQAQETVVENPVSISDRDQASDLIAEVMAGSSFGEVHREQYWRYSAKDDDQDEADLSDAKSAVSTWVRILARVFQFAAWLGAFAGVLWLVVYLSRALGWIRSLPQRKSGAALAQPLHAHAEAALSTLETMRYARAHAAAGQYREALAYLYRATLLCLIEQHALRVPESATEGECWRLVRQACPHAVSTYFTGLSQLWVQAAYAHRLPAPAQVEALLSEWPQVFAKRAGAKVSE